MSAATTVSSPAVASRVNSQVTPVEIDYSCRKPLMALFTQSILWLVISLLLTVLASIKLHGPGMLASMPGLTYGRVAAAASSSFLYGFASQAGIAIALWLICRLGRTTLVFGGGVIVGSLLWNVGVLLGVLGIFYGNTTGFERFEMPLFTVPILFLAYTILGVSGVVTYHSRTKRESYPSTWFILTALFVFPWVYSTAGLLLGAFPVRGPMQPVVAYWFSNNFLAMWLTPLALAVLFYFISKLSQQPLYSYGTAVFAFWTYILVAHATGFQHSHALPKWMPVLSTTINVFVLPTVFLAIGWCWYKTWAGHGTKTKEKSPEAKYVAFAAVSFILAGMLTALASLRQVDLVVGFTIFQFGLGQLGLFAFVAMAFFGAIVHIVPRLTDIQWPILKFTRLHFTLSVVGLVLSIAALLLGGVIQGNMLNNPRLGIMDTLRKTIPFVGISTLGLIVFLVAQLLLLANIGAMFKACCGGCREVNR